MFAVGDWIGDRPEVAAGATLIFFPVSLVVTTAVINGNIGIRHRATRAVMAVVHELIFRVLPVELVAVRLDVGIAIDRVHDCKQRFYSGC
jgi:hypothetical protein